MDCENDIAKNLQLKNFRISDQSHQHIDFRCEDGRVLVSVDCVTISNLDLLSSGEMGVNSVIRS